MSRKRVEQRPPFATGAHAAKSQRAKSSAPRTAFQRFERQVYKMQENRYIQRVSTAVTIFFGVFAFLNIIAPFVVYACPTIMSHLIFQHVVHLPFKNLSRPLDFGMTHTYASHLDHDDVKLGIWHTLPVNDVLKDSSTIEEHFKLNAAGAKPIFVLYLHGNTNDRSTGHRVQLYTLLRNLGYHVVSMDYRGYGDSTGTPTEDDVVKDVIFTYEHLQRLLPHATIYIWGHSLGTGIGSKAARLLTEKNNAPPAIVLEAPFYNIYEEVELHPLTRYLWPYNPPLYWVMERALHDLGIQFRSDIHLTFVKSKILILHAEDDWVIPLVQGQNLYEIAKNGSSAGVTFHRVLAKNRCGHNNIHRAPELSKLIK